MNNLNYNQLSEHERQYVTAELTQFVRAKASGYSRHNQIRHLFDEFTKNNRHEALVALLEIYSLDKPDNYYLETGHELHSCLITIARRYQKYRKDVCTLMIDKMFYQTPKFIGDVVFMSGLLGEKWEQQFISRFKEGLMSTNSQIRKKAEIAKTLSPLYLSE